MTKTIFRAMSRTVFGALLMGVFVVVGIRMSTPAHAIAGINQQINFQGRLLNSQGAIVPDGNYNMQFKIYQDGDGLTAGNTTGSPAGTLMWTESHLNSASTSIQVKNGYMSVQLGAVNPFGASIDWNQDTLWLSINIGNTNISCTPFTSCSPDGEMLPMKRLSSTPYALNAGQLGGRTSDGFIQNQNVSAQTTSNFWISGTGIAATLQAATIDSPAGTTTLNIGTTNATAGINLNQNTLIGAGKDLSFAAGAGSFDQSLSSGTLKTGTGAVSLNGDVTVAASKSITITGGATGTRPGGAACTTEGMLYYDTTTHQLLTCSATGGKWQADRSTATKIVAASNSSQALKDAADYVANGSGDQGTINTALIAAAGGKVYLAEGTYTISSNISIPNNTTLIGAGSGTLITIPDGHNVSINAITNTTAAGNGTGITIQDLRLDGNKANQTGGTMYGIYFNGVGSGSGSSAVQGGKIVNVRSNNWNAYGIVLSSSANNTLAGNTTHANTSGGILLSSSNSNTLSGNTAQGNSSGGYVISSSSHNTITGNTAQGNSNGIQLLASSSNNTITGNTAQGNSVGVSLSSSNNNTISGNTIHDSGGNTNNNGFSLATSDYNNITGNTITDTTCTSTCYAINISDAASDKNYLEANRFTGSIANAARINDIGTGTIYAGQQTNITTSTDSDVSDFRFRGSTGSTTGFSIQSALGTSILNVNTSNGELQLGSYNAGTNPLAGKLVIATAANTNTVTLQSATQGGNYTLDIPALAGNATICTSNSTTACGNFIQNQNAAQQTSANFWIQGSARADTSVLTPTLDTATGVALDIGTSGTPTTTQINLNQNVVVATGKSLTLVGGATGTRPASPTEGMVYYDTTTKQLLTYANGKWQADRTDAVLVAASNSSNADKAAADYVATGTGDQTTIQSALDSADPSAGTRKSGKVFLFAGTYTVTDSINIPDNTTLTGAGRGSLIQFGNIAGQNKNMIQNKNTTASTGLVLRDIRLDGNKATNTTGTQHGVYLASSTFPGSGAGARIGSVVQNVWVSNFRSNGIYVHSQSGNSNISNNMVQDNAAIGIAVQSAHANNVTNNYVVGNATDGIWVSGSSYNVISMNNVNSNTNRGIVVDGSANSNTINGNALKDNGTTSEASILVLNAATTLISNNAIIDNTGSGAYAIDINSASATGVYMSNNTFTGSAVTNGIRDIGSGTVFAGQLSGVTGTGAYTIQNAGGTTISGGAINMNVSSNFAVNIGTGTTNAAVTLGNSANTTNFASTTINIGTVAAVNTIQGVAQTLNNTDGNQLTIKGSSGLGSGNGGTLQLSGGDAGATGVMGLINLNPTAFTGTSQNCTVASCSITTATVNANSTALINNTYSGSTVTLADPTILTAGRVLYVTNSGTQDMTLSVNGGGQGNTIALKPKTTATMFWNGSDWTAAGASSATDLQAAYNNTQSTAGGAELVLNPVGGAADGLTIRNNGTTPISGGLLEIQTSIGTNLFSVNSFGTELAANGGAETAGGSSTTFPANTWTNQLGTTVARTTTAGQYQTGQAGVSVATNSVNLGGVRNQLTANPVASTYTVSFTAASSTAGENTTTIEVFYSPDGGTTVSNRCTGFGDGQTNTRTISNNTNFNWTKVTCTLTATAPTGTPLLIIRQTDATNRTLYIDNLSFIRNDSTTRPASVQMGGGNTGGQVTLFTLDRSSTAPLVSNGDNRYIGSMYYDTTLGNIQCYEADGWGACGSAPDNIVVLTPEYSNAVLNGTGVGTMTADFCSNESGVLQVNTAFCANHVSRNYYRWTSPQASDQTYSIYVSYKLPVVFKQFYDDNTIKLTGYKDHATNGQVTLSVFRSNGSTITQCGSSTTVTTGTSAWNTTNLGGTGESSCGFLASETVIFKIDVMAKNNANVYVENLEFRYTNK